MSLEGFFSSVSYYGSPAFLCYLLFPAVYYWNSLLGFSIFTCTLFSDWLNGVIKWIIRGDRPYWWIEINRSIVGDLKLKHFYQTCETGPGTPSGHCMITIATIFPIFGYILHNCKSKTTRMLLQSLFIFGIISMSLSRCYLSAHFPHQVILGVLIGLLIGYLFSFRSISIGNGNKHVCSKLILFLYNHPQYLYFIALLSFAIVMVISWILNFLFNFDVNITVRLAAKSCQRSEWVHESTSVMVVFVRTVASLCGLACSIQLRKSNPFQKETMQFSTKLFHSLLICVLSWFFKSFFEYSLRLLLKKLAEDREQFVLYFGSFTESFMIPFIPIVLLSNLF